MFLFIKLKINSGNINYFYITSSTFMSEGLKSNLSEKEKTFWYTQSHELFFFVNTLILEGLFIHYQLIKLKLLNYPCSSSHASAQMSTENLLTHPKPETRRMSSFPLAHLRSELGLCLPWLMPECWKSALF